MENEKEEDQQNQKLMMTTMMMMMMMKTKIMIITAMNCPACKGSYHDDKVWVECEFCHQWYHADCAGYSGWIAEDLQLETFFCSWCI